MNSSRKILVHRINTVASVCNLIAPRLILANRHSFLHFKLYLLLLQTTIQLWDTSLLMRILISMNVHHQTWVTKDEITSKVTYIFYPARVMYFLFYAWGMLMFRRSVLAGTFLVHLHGATRRPWGSLSQNPEGCKRSVNVSIHLMLLSLFSNITKTRRLFTKWCEDSALLSCSRWSMLKVWI